MAGVLGFRGFGRGAVHRRRGPVTGIKCPSSLRLAEATTLLSYASGVGRSSKRMPQNHIPTIRMQAI
jgi:hypothetical protein